MENLRNILRESFELENTELDEVKTPQEIGYHISDYGAYYGVKATGSLSANHKQKKWDGRTSDWNVLSLDGVYITNNLPKAIRYYAPRDGGSTYIFIIKYTLKTALSDPQYDMRDITGKFYKESGLGDEIQARRDNGNKYSLDDVKNWVAKYDEAFIKNFHAKLSKGNSQVPFKKELFEDFLFLSICKDFRWSLEDISADHKFWDNVVSLWHRKADAISKGYSGFKRDTGDAVRLTGDVGFSGKNKIVGIIHAQEGRDTFNRDLRNTDSWGGGRDERKERTVHEVPWYNDYGDIEQNKQLTGLKVYKNDRDRWDQEYAITLAAREKEKAELANKKRLERLAKAKQARLAKKQAKATGEAPLASMQAGMTEDAPAASYTVENLMFAMFDPMFEDYGQYYIPLLTGTIKKIFDNIEGYGWHLLDSKNIPRLKSIEGTNKAISTLQKSDIPKAMAGITGSVDSAALVHGNVLLKYDVNAWTVVDEDGNRWVPIQSKKTGAAISPDVVAIQKKYEEALQQLATEMGMDSWHQVHAAYATLDEKQKDMILHSFIKAMEQFMLMNKESIKNNIYQAIDVSEEAMTEVETGFSEIVISNFKIVKIVPIGTFKAA